MNSESLKKRELTNPLNKGLDRKLTNPLNKGLDRELTNPLNNRCQIWNRRIDND